MRDLWSETETKKGGVQQRGVAAIPKKLNHVGVTRLIERERYSPTDKGASSSQASGAMNSEPVTDFEHFASLYGSAT